MSSKSGGKLRPANSTEQRRGFADVRVVNVLATMWNNGLLATKGAFNRVLRWFGNMAAGSVVDLRTPFYAIKGSRGLEYRPQDEIVAMFQPALEESLERSDLKGDTTIREWEAEQAESAGPMSMFQSWFSDGPKKAEAVFSDKPRSVKMDERAYRQALDEAAAIIPRQSIPMSSLEEAKAGSRGDGSDAMDGSTNSGLPYAVSPWWYRVDFETGTVAGRTTSETQECSEWLDARAAELLPILARSELPLEELPLWEALSGQRLVQKGMEPYAIKAKRLVVAMPKLDAILGRVGLIGIVDKARTVCLRGNIELLAAWNPAWFVDEVCEKMLRQAEQIGEPVLSGDISAFDATIPPFVLEDVGRIIASWVRGGTNLINNLVRMVIYRTRLWTPSGSYGPGPSSMKSGSWFTSIGGSLANTVLQLYGDALGLYQLDGLTVLGDDFCLLGRGLSPEATSETFSHFGMEAHPTKQLVSPRHMLFLQRIHVLNRIGGIASCNRTLASALSLERLNTKPREWNKYCYVVQALAKIQNTAFHPGHAALADFLANGDRLHLGRDMLPRELVTAAGTAANKILDAEAHKPWKSQGSGAGFEEWTTNGVLRGEVLPPAGDALFTRVYGRSPFVKD